MPAPTILDILAARRRIAPYVQPTLLRHSPWLSAATGRPVYLKLESLNFTNSFKIRGAFSALARVLELHPDAGTRPEIVTASAGNHGRAMAYAAERLGMRVV